MVTADDPYDTPTAPVRLPSVARSPLVSVETNDHALSRELANLHPVAELTQRLSSTPRGARLARRLTENQLALWGYPCEGDANDIAQHVVAELAANAVTHGRVPGRDFELRLVLLPEDTLRIEVSDARSEGKMAFVTEANAETERGGEGGRGLSLVSFLALTWGISERAVGKTVWAELLLR